MQDTDIAELSTSEIVALERLYWIGCCISHTQYNNDNMLDLIRAGRELIRCKSDLHIVFRLAIKGNLPIVFTDGHILIMADYGT